VFSPAFLTRKVFFKVRINQIWFCYSIGASAAVDLQASLGCSVQKKLRCHCGRTSFGSSFGSLSRNAWWREGQHFVAIFLRSMDSTFNSTEPMELGMMLLHPWLVPAFTL
jgi:hypothetical protein